MACAGCIERAGQIRKAAIAVADGDSETAKKLLAAAGKSFVADASSLARNTATAARRLGARRK